MLAAALAVTGCGPGESDSGGEGGDGGAESSAVDAALLGQVPTAKVSELAGAMGMWTTEKNFVKTDLKKISGYPLSGGKAEWEIPLGGEVCWSSPQATSEGLIAVLFRDDKDDPAVCTEVGLVDLDKGKLLWRKQGLDTYGGRQMFDEVTIGGGTVAAAGTGGSAGWTTGGKPLWSPASTDDEKCPAEGFAGEGEKLVAVRDCGDTDHPKLTLQTIDPATRAVKSAYAFEQGIEHAHVVSAEPLVVAVDDGDSPGGSGITAFLTIDDGAARGKPLATIGTKGGKYGKYDAECPSTNVTDCRQLAVDEKSGTLFLPTRDPGPGSAADNDVVAFDLKTGKKKGTVPGTAAGAMTPVGVDGGGKVVVYQDADIVGETGGAVWRIDPASYKKTKVMQNPGASYEMESRFETDRRTLFAGERLYLGADHVSEPSEVYKKKQPLAVVFGAK
ncbi:hypothetical protein CP970_14030 [Streptomyces kanamyceticus]|uniref:Secreted protein n=1 Tax=Streptomyces kanamyceticus TaxID=1967 RepID=A0A5J6GFA4_STRKN|nr:hypothetical protein CP970_14030 [Streptomyces kanamyceticus]